MDMSKNEIPNTVAVIEKLRWNAHLNKHIHFNASKRDRRYHILVGVPIVIITVLLSFFLAISGADRPAVPQGISAPTAHENTDHRAFQAPTSTVNSRRILPSPKHFPAWAEWVGAFLALFAAALSGIQTFFNFQKEYEGHRQIGNQYLSVAKGCERLIAFYFDGMLELADLPPKLEVLDTKYQDVNSQAETFNVTDKDYEKAKLFQERKDSNEPSLFQCKLMETLEPLQNAK